MTSSTSGEILATWEIDPETWRRFVDDVLAHVPHSGHRKFLKKRFDAYTADRGRTVAVTVSRDAIRVGSHRFRPEDGSYPDVVERGSWLEFVDDVHESGIPIHAVPLPPDNPVLGRIVADHFRARFAPGQEASRRRSEAAAAERARPTPANRLLWFVERHFIACLLAFFFVVLPLGAWLAAAIAGR